MATIIIPNFLTQKVVNGLNNYQYTTTTAAMHNCRIEIDRMAKSTMTISIVQAGSVNQTLATVTLVAFPLGMPQTPTILQACANCAPGDTITFSVTSNAPIDQQLNTVMARLNVHVGGLN